MTSIQDNLPYLNHTSALVKTQKQIPDRVEEIEKLGIAITNKLGLTIVQKDFYKFIPNGITYIFILSQSHLVIHTWPELNTYHFDLLSCKVLTQKDFETAINEIFQDAVIVYSDVVSLAKK